MANRPKRKLWRRFEERPPEPEPARRTEKRPPKPEPEPVDNIIIEGDLCDIITAAELRAMALRFQGAQFNAQALRRGFLESFSVEMDFAEGGLQSSRINASEVRSQLSAQPQHRHQPGTRTGRISGNRQGIVQEIPNAQARQAKLRERFIALQPKVKAMHIELKDKYKPDPGPKKHPPKGKRKINPRWKK